MESTERQTAAEGLIGRAAQVLRHRDPSFAQPDTDGQDSEQLSMHARPSLEEDSGLVEAFAERIRDTVRFSSPGVAYSLAAALKEATYRRLLSRDTASAHVISLTLAVAIELILACFIAVNASQGIQMMRIAGNLVVGVVYAQSAASTPAALPQSTVIGLIWLAALVLGIVILGLLWSGYLARSKNEKAQGILQHLVNTVLSVATGALVSKGLSGL
jgi:hypothetical protein